MYVLNLCLLPTLSRVHALDLYPKVPSSVQLIFRIIIRSAVFGMVFVCVFV